VQDRKISEIQGQDISRVWRGKHGHFLLTKSKSKH